MNDKPYIKQKIKKSIYHIMPVGFNLSLEKKFSVSLNSGRKKNFSLGFPEFPYFFQS